MFNRSKQNPRIWILTILAIGLTLFVVACGGSEPPPPTLAPTSTPGEPTATPMPEPPTATPTPSADDRVAQGIAYYEQDELEKAIVEYKKAIELEPDNPDAHRNLGSVYVKQGKWEEAVAAYEQAIELAPNFGEAYGDLVSAYVNLDKLSEAIDAGEKAIELAPNYATGHNNLGVAYKQQGQLDKAVAEYQEAIRLDPDYAMPHYNWGLINYTQGQIEQAIAEWEEAARLDPNYANTHKNLGIVYLELGQAAEALAEFEIYLQLAPGAHDRAAVEEEIAKLNAQIAASSEETAGQGPQSGKDMLITEAEANAFYVGTWKFDADTRNEGEFASDCRDFLDNSGEEIWYRTFTNCVFDPKPGVSLDDIPTANILESAHSGELDLLFYAFQPDSDHVVYDMYTVQNERVYLASIVHRNPMLGAGNAPQRSDIDDFLYNVLVTNLSKTGAEPSLMDIDINRAPGHSIGFEKRLEPGGSHRFLFLASPGDTISAGVSSTSDMLIGIQDTNTGQVLGAAPNNDDPLVVTIPQNALYHIVIEDASGQGGDYTAAFEASPKVSFALDPNYFIIGRLPEGGLLYYTYTAPGGAILQGNVIPHPDTPIDLVVKILDLESQAVLFEANESGPGENEQFTFTVPDSGDGKLLTYIVSVEDVDKNKGAYIFAITSDAPIGGAPATSPESVVQTIFEAAKSGDFASLKDLCDPLGENDGDTQMICDLATDDTNREEFVQYFAPGKISGDAIISRDGIEAEVPFLFGPDGDIEETMNLINRDGQWYLSSF